MSWVCLRCGYVDDVIITRACPHCKLDNHYRTKNKGLLD